MIRFMGRLSLEWPRSSITRPRKKPAGARKRGALSVIVRQAPPFGYGPARIFVHSRSRRKGDMGDGGQSHLRTSLIAFERGDEGIEHRRAIARQGTHHRRHSGREGDA